MTNRLIVVFLLVSGLVPGLGASAEPGDQRIVVPLTDPARPVQLEVEFLAGQIEVTGYDGREVVVIARNNTQRVEREHGSEGMKRIPNTALGLSVSEQKNQVSVSGSSPNYSVDVLIQVPFRTSGTIQTTNRGDIVVRKLQGELELHNTNGGIEASDIKGSVVANTTNGGVVVSFVEVTPGKPMSFTTLNGNVDVSFPPSFKADLRIEPGRGDILTDFDFELIPTTPKIERKEGEGGVRIDVGQDVRAKIGGGGAVVQLKTFNGRIFIRKSR
jgi:DUF4097 and DUF4098 domain-containing protein YvlB